MRPGPVARDSSLGNRGTRVRVRYDKTLMGEPGALENRLRPAREQWHESYIAPVTGSVPASVRTVCYCPPPGPSCACFFFFLLGCPFGAGARCAAGAVGRAFALGDRCAAAGAFWAAWGGATGFWVRAVFAVGFEP